MKVDPALVRQVAALARLRVPEDRHEALAAELSAILDYVDQLGSVEGLSGAFAEAPPLPRRVDTPEPPLGRSLIALAAERAGDEVRVPSVTGEAT